MSSFHGVIAWCLLLATLLWSVKTRSSLSQQLAEMRQFSSASESETFEKMSRMTKQIADKNKEIGDLNKTQRANQRTIADLETQNSSGGQSPGRQGRDGAMHTARGTLFDL